jgi:signal peptidase II
MQLKARIFFPVAIAVMMLDVISKHLAQKNLQLHQPMEVLGDFFRFTLSFNTAAAFGLSVLGGSRWVYVGLTAVIVFTLWTMFRDAPANDRWQATALGLIVGGAIGNVIDRIRWSGGVVDFIDVGIGDHRFWTFNVADSGISVGATMMVLLFLYHSLRKKTPEETAASGQGPR